MMRKPRVLILHAPGTNRDGDLAYAIESAGGTSEIRPLSLYSGPGARGIDWQGYAMLALPGGFSYGDALGAGRLWALDLQTYFHDALTQFVEAGKPVIGICNGFQALVKAGILPGELQNLHSDQNLYSAQNLYSGSITLTFNASGHFECRWVRLAANPKNPSPWLAGLTWLDCPVAHGEGRFWLSEGASFPETQIAFQYAGRDGRVVEAVDYPSNPNGSWRSIAGITNARGNVFGLMPHPEDHIHVYQSPSRESAGLALQLFRNGLKI